MTTVEQKFETLRLLYSAHQKEIDYHRTMLSQTLQRCLSLILTIAAGFIAIKATTWGQHLLSLVNYSGGLYALTLLNFFLITIGVLGVFLSARIIIVIHKNNKMLQKICVLLHVYEAGYFSLQPSMLPSGNVKRVTSHSDSLYPEEWLGVTTQYSWYPWSLVMIYFSVYAAIVLILNIIGSQ